MNLLLRRFNKAFLSLLLIGSVNSNAKEFTTETLFEMSLEELLTISVASKRVEKVQHAPAIVSVITASDIELFGYNSLKDILERSTHLQIVGSNLFPHNKSTIRGINNSHIDSTVLLQINGRPIREAELSSMNHDLYSVFPVNAIKKIEIIRGPGSVLYGTNAFAGVINIVTHSGNEETLATASLNYRTLGSRKLEASVSTQVGETELFLALSDKTNDSERFENVFDEFGKSGSYPLGSQGYQLFLKADYKNLTANALIGDSTTDHVRSIFSYPATKLEYQRQYFDIGYMYPLLKDWQLKLNALYHKAENVIPFLPESEPPPSKTARGNYLAEATLQGSINNNINLLVGLSFEKSESKNVDGFRSYTRSIYSQVDWQSNSWLKFIAGVQFNLPDEADNHWSPRVGMIAQLSDNWGAKFLHSDAFREASPLDRFIDLPTIKGNPSLEPETISTTDVQLYYQDQSTFFAVTGFQSEQKNLLSRELGTPIKIVNKGQISYKGIEIEVRKDFSSNWLVTGNATYQSNSNELGQQDVTFAPDFMLKLGTAYRASYGSLGAFVSHFDRSTKQNHLTDSERMNSDPAGYTLVSINASTNLGDYFSHKMADKIELSLLIDNLLDERIYFPSILRTNVNSLPHHPGRSFSATVKFNF